MSELSSEIKMSKSLSDYLPKPKVNYPSVPAEDVRHLKKVHVQTWGCQMNVADTERMLALLGQCNYRPVESAEEADLVLLNTCHIREKARHKVVSRLGELRPLKLTSPHKIFAVAGCVAQAEAKRLAEAAPYIDLIFGPDQIEELPKLLESLVLKQDMNMQETDSQSALLEKRKPVSIHTGFNKDPYSIPIDVIPPWHDETRSDVSRYVNIIKGCNNFCTFCVVPFTRGREKSRPEDEIMQEARYLVDKGVREIVLLGQNVNSYGLDLCEEDAIAKGRMPFVDLIKSVASINGLDRIRFTTSNPHDFTHELADVFATEKKLCNSFHLPVQSGSTRILERMNRQYTRAQYLERVDWIRAVRPEIAFSTDIIVGFPGETEADFEDTMSLVQHMQYAFLYAFKYSPRRGTAASRFLDQVDEKVKDRRLQCLLNWQKQETLRQNQAEVGKVREALILYKDAKNEHSWYGRTYEGRLVKVNSPRSLIGQILPVQVIDANATALVAHPF